MKFKIHPQLAGYMSGNPDEDTIRASIQKTGGVFASPTHPNPVVLWKAPDGGLYLLDGHTRYRICTALGLPFEPSFVTVQVPDLDAALRWMREHQDAKRQLTRDQQIARDVLAGIEPKGFLAEASNARRVLAEDRALLERVASDKGFTLRRALNGLKARQGITSAPRKATSPKPAQEAPAATPETPAPAPCPVAEYRMKSEIADLKAANKAHVAEIARIQDEFAALTTLVSRPPQTFKAPKKASSAKRKGVPVMLCSDWHVEEPVIPETVSGLNEYNLDIADRCIDRLAEGYEWMLRDSRYDCREGVVWLGGDLMSGYIHDELVEVNALSPVEVSFWLQERLERMLRRIAATTNLERIIVPCNSGNHGRTTEKTRVQTRESNSYEWLVYQSVAKRLSDDPRFDFQIAQSEWLYLDVMGYTLAFAHGDGFKYQGGVGGVSIPIRKKLSSLKQHRPIHHACIGHFHTRQDFGDVSVNGSMIGLSPYSIRIGAPPETRQQSWFLVDSERGKCLSAPIWL